MKRLLLAVAYVLGVRWLVKIMHDDEYAEKWGRRLHL